jgi:hypothetical protein
MTFDRGKTSKKLLELAWDYPVHKPETEGQTLAVTALPRDQAFAEIADGDRRPVLVLRECSACAGSNLALLTTDASNDRTLLLARWFHCVKLEPEVVGDHHPYRNLFGARPSHLFLSLADGSSTIDLDGRQSQNDLWKALSSTLRAAYGKDADKTTKALLSLLDDFDRVDAEIARIQGQLDQALEKDGARSTKIVELQKKLEAAQAEHRELIAKEQQLRDLGQPKPGD